MTSSVLRPAPLDEHVVMALEPMNTACVGAPDGALLRDADAPAIGNDTRARKP